MKDDGMKIQEEDMSLNWGIVSASKICHDFVTAVQSIPEGRHKIVAVASRSIASAQEFAHSHDIPKAYGSYQELAQDPDIDIIYVGTVTSHHFGVVKLMLENGKHVLVEKPMTLNAKQTKALIAIAKERKRFLMEAIWSRFFPANKYLMEIIKNGKIGDIVHVNVNFGKPFIDEERPMRKDLGQGSILDVGIYALNAVNLIYGGEKPLVIKSVGHLNEEGVDIATSSSLLFSNNRTASVTTSALAEFPCDLDIVGTKGKIKIPNPFWCPTKVETNGKIIEFELPDTIRPCNYMNSSGLRFEAMEVKDCINKGVFESSIMPLSDSVTLAEMMDDIRHQIGFYFPED